MSKVILLIIISPSAGAGKTYTMLGNLENPGVMFLTMMELYRRIDELKDDKICEVAVSYCEVGAREGREMEERGKEGEKERERERENQRSLFSPYRVCLEVLYFASMLARQ